MKRFPIWGREAGARSRSAILARGAPCGLPRVMLGLLLGLALSGVSVAAQQTRPVAADPGETTLTLVSPPAIQGCEQARIEVWINDVTDLYGIDIKLSFAPGVIEVVDSDLNIDGIQVEKGGFLQPDWVVRNEADNATGAIRYALTQLSPRLPVTGSGVLFIVHLRALSEQAASPIAFTRSDLSDRNGRLIPATAFGASIATVAPQRPQLFIEWLNATSATLSWTAASGVADYHLYREIAPYFMPVDPAYRVRTGLSYDDTGSLGDPADNYYYVVKSACADGFKSSTSNRVGEFDFALVPGTP